MFGCIHDPGLALFLSETPVGEDDRPSPLEWTAIAATLLLAFVAVSIPA
jgi:hypothetical protein